MLSKGLLKEREPAGAPHLQQWQEQLVEPPPLHEADRSLARAAHLVQQHQHRDLIRRHPVLDAEHVGVHHPIGHHRVEVEALVDAGHGAPRLNPGSRRPLTLKFRRREHHDLLYVRPADTVSQETDFALAVCRRPIREAEQSTWEGYSQSEYPGVLRVGGGATKALHLKTESLQKHLRKERRSRASLTSME